MTDVIGVKALISIFFSSSTSPLLDTQPIILFIFHLRYQITAPLNPKLKRKYPRYDILFPEVLHVYRPRGSGHDLSIYICYNIISVAYL